MTEALKPTRFEYIGPNGREITLYGSFEVSMQDNDRTVKIFGDKPTKHITRRRALPPSVGREEIARAVVKANDEWNDPWNAKKDPTYKGEKLPDWHDYIADAVLALTPASVSQEHRICVVNCGLPGDQCACYRAMMNRAYPFVTVDPAPVAGWRELVVAFITSGDRKALMGVLGKAGCKTCGGSGECDDAGLGDISFNSWICKECSGSGWNNGAVQEIVAAVELPVPPSPTEQPDPVKAAAREVDLLGWFSSHHLPLSLFQEAEDEVGNWVVVDESTAEVIGSGGTAYEALEIAHLKRCKGGDIDAFNGDCLHCGAPMGGTCQDTELRALIKQEDGQ